MVCGLLPCLFSTAQASPAVVSYILLPLPPTPHHILVWFDVSSKSKRKSNIRLPIKVPRYPFNRVHILSSARKEGCLVAIRRIIGIQASSCSPGVGEQRPKKNCFSFRDRGSSRHRYHFHLSPNTRNHLLPTSHHLIISRKAEAITRRRQQQA